MKHSPRPWLPLLLALVVTSSGCMTMLRVTKNEPTSFVNHISLAAISDGFLAAGAGALHAHADPDTERKDVLPYYLVAIVGLDLILTLVHLKYSKSD